MQTLPQCSTGGKFHKCECNEAGKAVCRVFRAEALEFKTNKMKCVQIPTLRHLDDILKKLFNLSCSHFLFW